MRKLPRSGHSTKRVGAALLGVVAIAVAGATASIAAAGASAVDADRKQNNAPPPTAPRAEPVKGVVIQHWTVADGEAWKKVYAKFNVAEWPAKAIVIEVTLTPQPYCCGARERVFRWRQRELAETRYLGIIAAERGYEFKVRFR